MPDQHESEAPFLIESKEGILSWAKYDASVKTYLSAHAICYGDKLILIDPIDLTTEIEYELSRYGSPIAIFVTNANHERATFRLKEKFNVPVICSALAIPHLSQKPEMVIESQPVVYGMTLVPIAGGSIGEFAIYSPTLSSVFIGDAIINLKTTGFQLLPDKYCENPAQLKESLKKLLKFEFRSMLFAHGNIIESDAKIALNALLI